MVVSGVASSALLSPLLVGPRARVPAHGRGGRERVVHRRSRSLRSAAWLVVVPLGAVLLCALPVLLSQADNALVWLAGNTGGIVVAVLVQAFNQTPALAFSLLAVIAASVLAVV